MSYRALSFYHKPRPKPRRSFPEANLQITVVQHLKLRGADGLLYFAPCNEGKRSAREGEWLKQKGMLPGVADLVILVPNRPVLFLELKARGEPQSVAQIAFASAARATGAIYALADNIDDSLAILAMHGAITRRAQTRRDEERAA